MTTVSLKLPNVLAAELAAAAAKRRVSKATLARELLSASLAPARPKLSAYEVMQAGCGVARTPRTIWPPANAIWRTTAVIKPVLLDTGPLVAFLNRQDDAHEWAVARFNLETAFNRIHAEKTSHKGRKGRKGEASKRTVATEISLTVW